MKAAKDFAFGFVSAICIAAIGAILLGLLFFSFQSPNDLKQAVHYSLVGTAFLLIFGGGEIAASFFVWNTPLRVKLVHFLGAVSAVIGTFIFFPLVLDALEETQQAQCRTVVTAEIGPISITREECED
ncbi:MAG: hypothetical protein MRY72_09570 [Aquisalinus sp.]|nr:hypothetical protein [Aquisalinus sp.]